MNKKIAASLTIAIFLLSTLAVLAPVQAHFTLGDLTSTYPYHSNDLVHKSGPIGYVWPGGGLAQYAGPKNGFPLTNTLSPGYVPPYVSAADEALLGAPQNWLQLNGHEYAPFGAVLAGSTGDLIFAINATADFHKPTNNGFSAWYILIPPEFGNILAEQVVTTVTDNSFNILVATLNMYDRYAPGWTAVYVFSDGLGDAKTTSTQKYINFTQNHDEWYYLRINGVKAPTVAGKYFFKMYLSGAASSGFMGAQFVPVENWPVLLVKGEIDPAIITGTIRYGGFNNTLYGNPVQEAGKVWAHMTTKLDPYTGNKIVDCTTATDRLSVGCVDAVGYFNSTANGHFEVEGVAPGIYDLYASVAGYPQAIIASNVQVLKGQSLHFDGYLNPGVVIHGNVYSKHQFGSEPWPESSYIKIELYNAPTNSHNLNDAFVSGHLVSWSPLPCVAGGQSSYVSGYSARMCGDPRTAKQIAFPWHDYYTTALTTPVFMGAANSADPAGVGPYQNWFVVADGTNDIFHFEFGAKAEYGAPMDMNGEVPQLYATWVNGLTPGRYYARAWVFRYVQSGIDGSTFQEYSFDVTPQEWAGDVSLPIDLRLSSWINKTVHFHNLPGTIGTSSINTGAKYLYGGLYDDQGVLWSWNVTTINAAPSFRDPAGLNQYCNTVGRPEFGSCNIQFWGFNDTWVGQNYGIPAGTYTPKVWVLGYLQQTFEKVSVTLSGTPTLISDHMYRGVGFNFTVYSIDWERPRVNRNWIYPGMDIEVGILQNGALVWEDCYFCDGTGSHPAYQDSSTYYVEMAGTGVNILPNDNAAGVFFGTEGSSVADRLVAGGYSSLTAVFTKGKLTAWTLSHYHSFAFDSGQYDFRAWTYGYIQNKGYSIYANKGQVADIKINMIIGTNVTLDILFKKEHLITPTATNMSARVRLFDDTGKLVAEWMSSMGGYGNSTAHTNVFLGAPSGRFGAATGTRVTGTANYLGGPVGAGLNYVPYNTTLLHVELAGLPVVLASYGDPILSSNVNGYDFEVDLQDLNYFPNAGILGSPDYTGGWTAEVDFVNLYGPMNSTGQIPFYPPVPGLLMGESFHVIPGSTSKYGISLTEDLAMDTTQGVGHSMAHNHLGPYAQQGVWSINNAANSGEASGVFEVDLNGYVTGSALAFTWSNEYRPVSWYSVQVVGADGKTFDSFTNDGIYEFFLTPGSYTMTIAGPGITSQSSTIQVTPGQYSPPGLGQNLYLEQSQIPVPEFSGIAVVAFSALAASLYLLRRRRK